MVAMLACFLAVFMLTIVAPSGAVAKELRLEDFIVLVDYQLRLSGAASVLSFTGGLGPENPPIPRRSDLGSRDYASIGGNASTYVPTAASAVTDVAIIARRVTLRNFAKVSQVIYDDVGGSFNDVGTSGRVGPSLLQTFADNSLTSTDGLEFPAFPAFPTITPSLNPADDIIVPTNVTKNIVPGTYRDLVVAYRGIARFKESGTYIFRRIIANVGVYNLIMDVGDIEIRVQDFVHLAEYGSFNPTDAKDVTLFIAGQDGSYGADSRRNRSYLGVTRAAGGRLPAGIFPAAFQYTGDGVFNACFVYVPNGTMNLGGVTTYAAQWFGDSWQEIRGLRITLKHPGEICFESPGIECACITNFNLKANGTLKVTGVNFSTATIERLAVFTEGYSAVLGGVTQGDASADQLVATLDITAPDTFTTINDVKSLLPAGNYFLGIIYPVDPKTGNTGGYCIFTDKALVIPAGP
jgi:hypothetical protein